MFLQHVVTKRIRTIIALAVVALAALVTVAEAATQLAGNKPELSPANIKPLSSVLASPQQCIQQALDFTAASSPEKDNKPVVAVAKRVNDDDFAKVAPKSAAKSPKFGKDRKMFLVVLKGNFKVNNHRGGSEQAPDVVYLMDQDCQVTVRTFDVDIHP